MPVRTLVALYNTTNTYEFNFVASNTKLERPSSFQFIRVYL